MKISRNQLRQIIKEEVKRLDEIPTYIKARARRMGVPHMGSGPGPRSYHQISSRMKSMANAAKRSFAKDYPEIRVGIDGAAGWITVNGRKAVNISSADGLPNDIEDMVDQMKKSYLGHPQPSLSMKDTDRDGIADFADTDKDNDGQIDALQDDDPSWHADGPEDVIEDAAFMREGAAVDNLPAFWSHILGNCLDQGD